MSKTKIHFHIAASQATFELYFSEASRNYRVRVADPDDSPAWDYEDEATAKDFSRELKSARSFEECREMLGV